MEAGELITRQVSVVGLTNGQLWGFLSLDVSVLNSAYRRIYLTHVALAKGRSAYEDVERLLSAALLQLQPLKVPEKFPDGATSMLIWYGNQRWLVAPLEKAGLAVTERIEFFMLARLQKRVLPINNPLPKEMTLRIALQPDLARLAEIDSDTFSPIWHITQAQLLELWPTHRVYLFEKDGIIVGYSALALLDEETIKRAHLARLAVDGRFQGQGFGRYLLLDALHFAQEQRASAVTLNTQTTNQAARELYRTVGFSRTGDIVPVMTQTIVSSQ